MLENEPRRASVKIPEELYQELLSAMSKRKLKFQTLLLSLLVEWNDKQKAAPVQYSAGISPTSTIPTGHKPTPYDELLLLDPTAGKFIRELVTLKLQAVKEKRDSATAKTPKSDGGFKAD